LSIQSKRARKCPKLGWVKNVHRFQRSGESICLKLIWVIRIIWVGNFQLSIEEIWLRLAGIEGNQLKYARKYLKLRRSYGKIQILLLGKCVFGG
jgi:hypothetical protein